MPELPEVETVKNSLKNRLLGKRILSVKVVYSNIIEFPSVSEFERKIKGQTIRDMNRYGKWIIFVLDDYYLLSHLRMEGKYFFKNKDEAMLKHEHVVFFLDDGIELRYHDVRKFGKMLLIPHSDIKKYGPFLKMGLEPWDDRLDVTYLKDKFCRKNIPIKSVLLDQSIIVGIGNIYADEILFLSGIHPLKKASCLSFEELDFIISNTKKVMDEAIKKGGTTIRSYTSVNGVHGLFQQELLVHGRDRKKCFKCGHFIEKIRVGGRGTYFCPSCQKFD